MLKDESPKWIATSKYSSEGKTKVPTHKELTVHVRIECLKNKSKYTHVPKNMVQTKKTLRS